MFNAVLTTFGIDVDLPHCGTANAPRTPRKIETCPPADAMLQRRHADQRNVLVHRPGRLEWRFRQGRATHLSRANQPSFVTPAPLPCAARPSCARWDRATSCAAVSLAA